MLRADHERVLADEAKPGAFRDLAFEQRAGVDIGAVQRVGSELGFQPAGELLQHREHHVVVVAAPRIARDPAARWLVPEVRRRIDNLIRQADADDRPAAFEHVPRVQPALRIAADPRHARLPAGGQPGAEGFRPQGWLGGGDTAGVETDGPGPRPQLLEEVVHEGYSTANPPRLERERNPHRHGLVGASPDTKIRAAKG